MICRIARSRIEAVLVGLLLAASILGSQIPTIDPLPDAVGQEGESTRSNDLLLIVDGSQNILYLITFQGANILARMPLLNESGEPIASRALGVAVDSEQLYSIEGVSVRDLHIGPVFVSFENGDVYVYDLDLSTSSLTFRGKFALSPVAYRLDYKPDVLVFVSKDNNVYWAFLDSGYTINRILNVAGERPQAEGIPQVDYRFDGVTFTTGGTMATGGQPFPDLVIEQSYGEDHLELKWHPYLYQQPGGGLHALASSSSLKSASLLLSPFSSLPGPEVSPRLTKLWREAPLPEGPNALAGTSELVNVTQISNGNPFELSALEKVVYVRSSSQVHLMRETKPYDLLYRYETTDGSYRKTFEGFTQGTQTSPLEVRRVETIEGPPTVGFESTLQIRSLTPDAVLPLHVYAGGMTIQMFRRCVYGIGGGHSSVSATAVLTSGDTFPARSATDPTLAYEEWVKLSTVPPELTIRDFQATFGEPPECSGDPIQEWIDRDWSMNWWMLMARSAQTQALWLNGLAYQSLDSVTLPSEILEPEDIDVINLSPRTLFLDLAISRPGGGSIPEDKEVNPGGLILLNNDNDDRDGSFDLADDNGVAGEDELVKLDATVRGGKARLSVTAGADKIRIWQGADRTVQATLPLELSESKTLWLEGLVKSDSERDVSLRLEMADFGASDEVKATVIVVQAISFEGRGNSRNDDNTLDVNSHPSGRLGLAVFPDARLQGAPLTPGPARDRVTVKVSLNLQVPINIPVYLKAFDVDDPSSNANPVDNELALEDNRGNAGGKVSGRLDGEGPLGIASLNFHSGEREASIGFHVTKQPGDNFRIAAHFDRDFLEAMRNDDSQGHAARILDSRAGEILGWASDVLTVWRKIHIEHDTMQQAAPAVAIAPDDDRAILPRQPDIGGLNAYLDDAYILAVDDLGALDVTDGVTFDEWTTDAEAQVNGGLAPCFEKRNVIFNTDDYWVVYILSVFQGEDADDRDPDNTPTELGFTPPIAGVDDNCVIIYQENIRDIMGSPIVIAGGFTRQDIERATVVHEVGHTLGAQHRHGEIMNNNWPEDFVDGNVNGAWDPGEMVNPIPVRFHDRSLDVMRRIQRPGA